MPSDSSGSQPPHRPQLRLMGDVIDFPGDRVRQGNDSPSGGGRARILRLREGRPAAPDSSFQGPPSA